MAVTDPDAVDTYGRRYVFATLDQHVVSLDTRLDWTLTPRLSIQLYLQPLVVSGNYDEFKEFARPGNSSSRSTAATEARSPEPRRAPT